MFFLDAKFFFIPQALVFELQLLIPAFFTASISIPVAVAKAPLTVTESPDSYICFSANTATAVNNNYSPRNYNCTKFGDPNEVCSNRWKASAGVKLSSSSDSVRHHCCRPKIGSAAAAAAHMCAPDAAHGSLQPGFHVALLAWLHDVSAPRRSIRAHPSPMLVDGSPGAATARTRLRRDSLGALSRFPSRGRGA